MFKFMTRQGIIDRKINTAIKYMDFHSDNGYYPCIYSRDMHEKALATWRVTILEEYNEGSLDMDVKNFIDGNVNGFFYKIKC